MPTLQTFYDFKIYIKYLFYFNYKHITLNLEYP